MLYDFFAAISSWIINIISHFGYGGVTFLMALESACIPVPSEIIMTFSGYLVWIEKMSFLPVVLWATLGNLLGSIVAYIVGFYGGRPFVEKYGKYLLISGDDLDRAENWFRKYGAWSVSFSRMLPVVRTFISLPAGIARMPFLKFSIYTALGSLPWAVILTYIGVIMGENWSGIEVYFRKFDWLVAILAVLFVAWWLLRKLKPKR